MTIKLSRLLEEIKPLEVIGETDKNIESLQSDSRKVGKGGMFVAVRGVTTDGHRYIPVVASAHVAAIVCEDLPASIEKGITYIRVADSAEAPGSPRLGLVRTPLVATSARGRDGHQRQDHHRHPTLRDGKNSRATRPAFCRRCATISRTVPYRPHTPLPILLPLNELLSEMVSAGCDYAFMEVSSHAAQQRRIAGLKFAGGVFSNLTRDHLDYHHTVDNYRNAKKMFFDTLPEDAFALVNTDDKAGLYMTQNTRAKVHTYSLRADADFRCKIL